MSVEIDNIYLPTNPDVNRDKKKEKGLSESKQLEYNVGCIWFVRINSIVLGILAILLIAFQKIIIAYTCKYVITISVVLLITCIYCECCSWFYTRYIQIPKSVVLLFCVIACYIYGAICYYRFSKHSIIANIIVVVIFFIVVADALGLFSMLISVLRLLSKATPEYITLMKLKSQEIWKSSI